MMRHAIAALRLVQVVRRDEHGAAGARESVDEPPELAARHRIDAAGRLVEKQDGRLVQERAPKRQPLPPAAGQIARQRALAAAQAGHLEHEPAARSRARRPQPVNAAVEADVLVDGQQLVQREALRHVPDAPLDAFRIPCDIDAVDQWPCRTSAAAARRASGSSWTSRRRCCPESRRPRPAPTRS